MSARAPLASSLWFRGACRLGSQHPGCGQGRGLFLYRWRGLQWATWWALLHHEQWAKAVRGLTVSTFSTWLSGITAPSHASEWISGLWGALGAIFGGAVTMCWTEWFNTRSRRRDQKARFAAVTFSAYQRLNHMYSVTTSIRDHLVEGCASRVDSQQPLFLTVRPMMRMSPPMSFPPDEVWDLTQIGGHPLTNAVNSLDYAFNVLLDSMDDYFSRRRELMALFPPPEEWEGDRGSLEITADQLKQFRPRMAELDMSIDQMRSMATSLTKELFQALKMVVYAKSKPLGDKFEIGLRDPEGHQISLKAGAIEPTITDQRSGSPAAQP